MWAPRNLQFASDGFGELIWPDERPPAQLPPPERHEVVKETFNKVVADMSEVVQVSHWN